MERKEETEAVRCALKAMPVTTHHGVNSIAADRGAGVTARLVKFKVQLFK